MIFRHNPLINNIFILFYFLQFHFTKIGDLVRIKVSSWVTNFVSEMKTKSPAVVQRWVDSLPNDSINEIPGDTLNVNDSLQKTHTIDEQVTEYSEKNSCACETDKNILDINEQLNELNVCGEDETHSKSGKDEQQSHSKASSNATIDDCVNNERRFWQKGPSLLTALRIRSVTESNRGPETVDLNASPQLPHSSDETECSSSTASTNQQPVLNKSKLNEIYYKLNINKKRYNFIKDRKMDAKKLLNNAKSRFLAAANWDESQPQNEFDTIANEELSDNNITEMPPIATQTIISEPETSGTTASVVCDTIDMDLSADEFSRLSQSNDMLSVDDEDSFNVSMPSINDSHTTHLNVSRKIAMADIGRSTSDNPRLRNKFYLADIGRSFSEHQDDEAILIGERNISAPTSSIAIQNNNRSNGNFYERRAYSVSPTQRGLKRGILSRDHSLSDSSRHRNQLSKGSSFQSDSSHCSSVESLLDARKPDSEAILRQLGFGPAHQEDLLSRIPKR